MASTRIRAKFCEECGARLALSCAKCQGELSSAGELAKRAKVSRAYVAVLEAGHRKNPSPETLKRPAKALGVSLGDLLA